MAITFACLNNPKLLQLGLLPACAIILSAGLFHPAALPLAANQLKAKLRQPKHHANRPQTHKVKGKQP